MYLEIVPKGGQGEPLVRCLFHQWSIMDAVEKVPPYGDADAGKDARGSHIQHLSKIDLSKLQIYQYRQRRKDDPAEERQARPSQIQEINPGHLTGKAGEQPSPHDAEGYAQDAQVQGNVFRHVPPLGSAVGDHHGRGDTGRQQNGVPIDVESSYGKRDIEIRVLHAALLVPVEGILSHSYSTINLSKLTCIPLLLYNVSR